MFATDLPSIWRWKARFHPKFGTLFTIRRPGGGLPCATVLMEIAHRKARIRRTLLTKLCLGFMAHITHTTGFSPVLWPKPKPKHTGESRCVQTGERENALSAYERAKPPNIVISGIFSAYFCPLLLIWAGNAEEPSHHHGAGVSVEVNSRLVSATEKGAVIRKILEIIDVGKFYRGCDEPVAREPAGRSAVEPRPLGIQKFRVFGVAHAVNPAAHPYIHIAPENRVMKLQEIIATSAFHRE